MLILGIETSCDDTAAAVVEVKKNKAKILSNIVLSQTSIHAPYGGVVPQVAARSHAQAITGVVGEAIARSGVPLGKIDLIAVTRGPGLIITLLVGTSAAKTLAYTFNKPIVGVNHLEGHIYAHELAGNKTAPLGGLKFPAVCLLVSGGHTMLILLPKYSKYEILGETRDDAVGEAFDKVARLLRLGYPGGPLVEEMARQGNSHRYELPRAMMKTPDYDFSLSGLKTAVLREIKNDKKILNSRKLKADLCASFQLAAFEPLAAKFTRAAEAYRVKTLILGGGVAANKTLQVLCRKSFKKHSIRAFYKIPETGFTSDNAAMIALAGYYRYKTRGVDKWYNIKAEADLLLK